MKFNRSVTMKVTTKKKKEAKDKKKAGKLFGSLGALK